MKIEIDRLGVGEKMGFMTERALIHARQEIRERMNIAISSAKRHKQLETVERYQIGVADGLQLALDILKEHLGN